MAQRITNADDFDAYMAEKTKVGQTIRLDAGLYLTRGDAAWALRPGASLVGAGVKKTIIRRVNPSSRFVVDGWTYGASNSHCSVSNLTIDCNANPADKVAPCGLGLGGWRNSMVEHVHVIGTGNLGLLESESFGIILHQCNLTDVSDCLVEGNLGGYVTAFCLTGKTLSVKNCRVKLTWKTGWHPHLAGFATAGATGNTEDLWIEGNRVDGARYGLYCDTSHDKGEIQRLTWYRNYGTLRSWGGPPVREVYLTGNVNYRNFVAVANRFKSK